jgi:hypothetical protein
VPQLTHRASRDAALVELQRLHAAILASRAKRGAPLDGRAEVPSPEALAARELTRRLQTEPGALANDAADAPRSRRLWWLAAVAAVVVAGVWLAMTQTRRPEVVTEASPPADTPASATPRPASSAPTPSAAPTAAAPGPAAPLRAVRVTLATIRPVWLLVIVDGKRAHRGTVETGGRLTFDGDRAIVVRSGDAGAVSVSLNDADRGPLGRRGWPLTVSITPDGIEPLTPTRPEP